MQSFKEEKEEIRKPSSVINAKKSRKTTEWERLEISSGKIRDTKGTFAEGNGTPLQYSCLENPRDGGLPSMGSHRAGHNGSEAAKGTFHAKMGSIKDRNGMDVTEPKILRRGGKNTEKTYIKKIFTTQINTMV